MLVVLEIVGWFKYSPMLAVPVTWVLPVRFSFPGVMLVLIYWVEVAVARVGAAGERVNVEIPVVPVLVSKEK